MTPDGLACLGSWVETDGGRCFQRMDCGDARLLEAWARNWRGLVDFEFVPVVTGAEMAARTQPLDGDADE